MATVDRPAAAFWEEIAAAFPDAIVRHRAEAYGADFPVDRDG